MDLPREATSHCQIAISLWQQELDWEQYLVEGVRTDVDLSGLRDDDGVSGRGKQQELDWEQYLVEGVRTDEAILLDLSGLRDDGGVSGRGKSEDGKLSYGYTRRRGHRVTMDGTYDIKISTINGQSVCMVGIFDAETFQQTHVDFLDLERLTYRDDGSAAITAVVVGNRLYVAMLGTQGV
ncbi:hypothetical protein GOBAR_AA35004 [Gossypium barbadense]|uniref:Uncharacterized protein n=1 Tax=Gossypium barbadense TaxID=3634 RepID=A0A2P5W3I9_GOSBA|nr:hypothetical protein GOBAR_AA35004 [Gossypium barbadense]